MAGGKTHRPFFRNNYAMDEQKPENVPSGQAATVPEAGLVEKIKLAASGAYQKGSNFVNAVKRGRGRPPGTGKNQKAAALAETDEQIPPLEADEAIPDLGIPAPADSNISPGLWRRIASATVKGVTAILDTLLFRKVKAVSDADFAESVVSKCKASSEEIDDLAFFAELTAKKYNVDMEWAPEIGLLAVLDGIIGRYLAAFADVLKRDKKKQQEGPIAENTKQ